MAVGETGNGKYDEYRMSSGITINKNVFMNFEIGHAKSNIQGTLPLQPYSPRSSPLAPLK
jgi:hypothetical protein